LLLTPKGKPALAPLLLILDDHPPDPRAPPPNPFPLVAVRKAWKAEHPRVRSLDWRTEVDLLADVSI